MTINPRILALLWETAQLDTTTPKHTESVAEEAQQILEEFEEL